MEEVTVVDMKPQLVIGMRQKGRYQDLIPGMLKQLYMHIMRKGVHPAGPPVFVCHERPEEVEKAMAEASADVEVGVPIPKEMECLEGMKCYELPGGKFAKITHKGPYEKCEATYNTLFAWMKENGKCIVGPTREYYLNDPREVKPEEILTEVYAPID